MAKSERKEQYADYARRRTGRPCPSSTALRGLQHLGVAHHLFRASPKLPAIVLPGPAARGEPRDNSIARLKIEEALHPAGVEKVRRFANCKRSDGLLPCPDHDVPTGSHGRYDLDPVDMDADCPYALEWEHGKKKARCGRA